MIPDAASATLGLFIPTIHSYVHHLGWRGACEAARKHGANLICFTGRTLNGPERFESQANILYEFVDPSRLDGLIIWSGGLDWFIQAEEMERFIRRYDTLPVVSLETAFTGIPTLLIDNYQGMRDVMTHLVEKHGYRRIAFIRGSAHHIGEQQRYQAYLDVLDEHGIPVDSDLVTPHNNWEQANGEAAIRLMLDQHNAKFEAIVSANDEMLIGAIKFLHTRGMQVPEHVAVAGFDDSDEGRCMASPLTTVPFPGYELGRQAIETVLEMVQGREVSEQIYVPMKPVIRQSCGCLSPLVAQASFVPEQHRQPLAYKPLAAALEKDKHKLIADMAKALERLPEQAVLEAMELMVDAFIAELDGGIPNAFLQTVTESIHRLTDQTVMSARSAAELAHWQNPLSVLRSRILGSLEGSSTSRLAETLLQQARVGISEIVQRIQAYQEIQMAQRVETLRDFEAVLSTTFDVENLMNALAEGLPRLGIPGCYLVLYEQPRPYSFSEPIFSEWSLLLLAYDENGRADLGRAGQRFPSRELLPEAYLPRDKQYSLEAEALYFKEEQIGYILFEEGPLDGHLYQALRSQISSTLKGALLMEHIQERTDELTAANAKIHHLNEQLRSENLRMSAELDVARRLQKMVLPRARELRQIEDLDIAGFMHPADEVGGDYYDILSCHDEQLCIGIGDVTDHGLQSGVVMLMVQTAVRTLLDRGESDPKMFLGALNRVLYQNIERMEAGRSLTFSFIRYKNKQLRVTGQHEDILVVRKNGVIQRIDTSPLGFPLGLVEEIADFVTETNVSLEPGDGFVLYTDGITEAQNPEGEFYGQGHLCETISRHWNKSAEEIKSAVIDDVMRYIGTQKIYDDITLVVLKQR